MKPFSYGLKVNEQKPQTKTAVGFKIYFLFFNGFLSITHSFL